MIWYECTAEGPASLKCLILLSLSFLKAFLAASLAYFCRFQDTPGNKAKSPGKSWRILQNIAKNTFPILSKFSESWFFCHFALWLAEERNNMKQHDTTGVPCILQYMWHSWGRSVAWSSKWSYFLEYAFTFFLAAESSKVSPNLARHLRDVFVPLRQHCNTVQTVQPHALQYVIQAIYIYMYVIDVYVLLYMYIIYIYRTAHVLLSPDRRLLRPQWKRIQELQSCHVGTT